MAPMVRVIVNGRVELLDASLTLLEALERRGIHVPHLCHDARLAPAGACRVCLVELEGNARPVTACTQRVVDGMVVRTEGPALAARRTGVLRFLAHRYPPLTQGESDNTFVRRARRTRARARRGARPAVRAGRVSPVHPSGHGALHSLHALRAHLS
jgi:predicted molibdopterin-dependent oxidoreductase YjgC